MAARNSICAITGKSTLVCGPILPDTVEVPPPRCGSCEVRKLCVSMYCIVWY